jgi:hypothetical protein
MSSQDEAVAAVEAFISSMTVARAEMRKTEKFLQDVLQRVVDQGETVESLIELMPPAKRREALHDALEDVGRTRHLAREKVFSLALDRGVSVADLGRAWGFSRQLASRYVKGQEVPPAVAGDGPVSEEPSPDGATAAPL